jgi:replicative DNA helicase
VTSGATHSTQRKTDGGGHSAGDVFSRGRVPPQDLEAEKAVLSALLLDDDQVHAVVTEVKPEDFYHPAHKTIFQAMIELSDTSQPVDLLTLADHLQSRKLLDSIGGTVTLAEIAEYEATAANVLHHARIVRDKSVRRGVISAATDVVERGFEQVEPAKVLLDFAQERMFELGQIGQRQAFSSLDVELHHAMDFVDHLMNHGGEMTGVATGFTDLDKLTGGLQRGELIVLAARPSMGKTALALNVARNAAVDHQKKVAIFSLEMTTRSLVLRLLGAEAKVESEIFRNGHITVNAHARLVQAAGRLSAAHLWIDDGSATTVLEIKAKARRMKQERGLDLLILDYLQLARGDERAERREQEISEISRGLKGLAKELDIPVIALSQLNRGPESRSDKRPMLADLRESGAIEQDADLIAFIYRDEVYNKDTSDEGIAEIIVAKQRNGPTDTVKLQFEGRFTTFHNLATRDDAPSARGGFGPGGAGFGGPPPAADDDLF